jgi:hypothetical protein
MDDLLISIRRPNELGSLREEFIMARKFKAKQSLVWSGGVVGAGDVLEEGHPALGGDRAQFFEVESDPEPEPEKPIKAEVYVQPEQPRRRGRPPGSKNRPRG